ncbi:hypothetical protein M011DRAFT_9970 [Sporormia fimetaria CBS 119925]|uniref:RING-type domain-containing protein n=1 Tax=Sporormia fimetaria CBS 119925 TaxID=1340428 RepID=A0A6A6VP33_9PLEO|nr:hypothetical protein M011DRAFT_9970 [Sporormia fimetaria CBS 119925]
MGQAYSDTKDWDANYAEDEALAATHRRCQICTTRKLLDEFDDRTPTQRCEHEVSVCKACLEQELVAQFHKQMHYELDCPQCDKTLTIRDLEEVAPMIIRLAEHDPRRPRNRPPPRCRKCLLTEHEGKTCQEALDKDIQGIRIHTF